MRVADEVTLLATEAIRTHDRSQLARHGSWRYSANSAATRRSGAPEAKHIQGSERRRTAGDRRPHGRCLHGSPPRACVHRKAGWPHRR